MTGDAIRTMFGEIVDDEMDDTQFYIFLNAAKNKIENSRDWNFNRAFDNSLTVLSTDTYLTAKALPTTFLSPRKLFFHGDRSPLVLIGFEEREIYKDTYKRWYIDWVNRTFSICGATGSVGKTIDIFFRRQTPDIAAGTSPVWPDAFHPLLGFEMADMWQSTSDNDAENVALKASRESNRVANNLLKSMIAWDAQIKTLEYNEKNSRGVDLSSYPDVVDIY